MNKTKIEWTDSDIERFNKYIQKGKQDECILWTGGRFYNGYGQFRLGKKKIKAHRFSFVIHKGPIPEGMLVCHRCDNPICVNPDHLWLGTSKQNSEDRDKKGRMGDCGACCKKTTGMFKGVKNPAAKITQADADSIRKKYTTGKYTYRKLAKIFYLSSASIANVIKERTWNSEHN